MITFYITCAPLFTIAPHAPMRNDICERHENGARCPLDDLATRRCSAMPRVENGAKNFHDLATRCCSAVPRFENEAKSFHDLVTLCLFAMPPARAGLRTRCVLNLDCQVLRLRMMGMQCTLSISINLWLLYNAGCWSVGYGTGCLMTHMGSSWCRPMR